MYTEGVNIKVNDDVSKIVKCFYIHWPNSSFTNMKREDLLPYSQEDIAERKTNC